MQSQNSLMLIRIIVGIVIITILIPQGAALQNAFADDLNNLEKPSLFWYFRIAIEDFNEFVYSDSDIKKRRIAEHALQMQTDINKCLYELKTCPREFEERRLQKIEQFESIVGGDSMRKPMDLIKSIGEYNEIKITISEFNQIRTSNLTHRELLLDQINDRVRSFSDKLDCLKYIDFREFIDNDNYYNEIKRMCPELSSSHRGLGFVYDNLYQRYVHRYYGGNFESKW